MLRVDAQAVRTILKRGLTLTVLCAALFCCNGARAQHSSAWRVFKASDGLQDSFSAGLHFSPRRNLWIAHGEAGVMSATDGYEVRQFFLRGLRENRVYESRSGQLWALNPDGVQQYFSDSWIFYPVKQIRAAWSSSGPRAVSIMPLKQGHLLCLTPEQILEFSSESSDTGETTLVREALQSRLEHFNDIAPARDGGFWIAGRKGLAKVSSERPGSPENPWLEFAPPEALAIEKFQEPREDDQGGVCLLAESKTNQRKLLVYFDGESWSVLPPPNPEIRHGWRGANGRFWHLTSSALFELDEKNVWRQNDDVVASQFYDTATGPNGVFWLATSEGVFRFAPLTWQSVSSATATAPISAAVENHKDQLWFAQPKSLMLFEDERWKRIPLPLPEPSDILYAFPKGSLVLGHLQHLFTFDCKSESLTPLSHPSGHPVKPLGRLKDKGLCVQVMDRRHETGPIHLEYYDGSTFQPLLTVPANIHHGEELTFVFTTQSGALWIVAKHSLALFRDQKWQTFDPGEDRVPENASCMLDIGENKVWCGTRDSVWEFDGKEWKILESGLDRVNFLLKSQNGSVWVASNNGVHRYYKGEFTHNGSAEGLPGGAAVRVLVEDRMGRIWAGTARGLSRYHPEADVDPPRTFIQKPKADLSPEGTTTFFFYGRDRWKQTPTDRLLYSYRLDEQDWSPWQSEGSVSFADLDSGKHFFQVRAMDRNWNVDPKPRLHGFTVPLPWFKETRLITIAVLGLIGVLFFAALAFNRHLRLVRSYAEVERIVQLRTRQLEAANRDLFQSQKMNALGTLAAGVAHDFNSILSIIKGSAQIIETNLENPDKIRTRLDRIKTAVDQGAGIVRAMLGFSRTSERKFTDCDLNQIGQETIRLLGDRFQRDVGVEMQPCKDLPLTLAAKDFVQQILLNFILNAAEAMPKTGKIVLRTGVLSSLPSGLVLTPSQGLGYVFIAVEDSGVGIPPEHMSRLFEPFFTTKALSAKRGTGLGLSMVYQLAQEMGAGLSVESTLHQGSKFTLILPIHGNATS